ncbi:hypothetical protein GUITHDRAFT_73624 [Guillardia theta CCMP2712]|uniref:beta-aspartyl-peptidase n=1 Tax=Guillardia theta (strain CCMP2712) TaxID=905079 RepID=L1J415_GUITC|nr:hypothetical protein GUITHDRAFT_73624 [Guillardia theta CCMP2712]EKX42815.1 hypothetical protein GUITHDRAFT_73624 [Guillardia theta CCMP2712]|eukprot:XP_005829795.1 hypothetical protein GUITHDRAFT_73624 [Guillardia theta CCMP2712]
MIIGRLQLTVCWHLLLGRSSKAMITVTGGAGAINDVASIPARLQEFSAAFEKGISMLKEGATAIEVVQEVVVMLEDSAYFNAGRGSVFTNAGTHEMDASVMDGTTGNAGAVCNVSNVRNPVRLARAVATSTQHVLLCGSGAESLAPNHGIRIEDNHYFFTNERYEQLKLARIQKRVVLDHGTEMEQHSGSVGIAAPSIFSHLGIDSEGKKQHKFGTVGCVARDKYGNLAAAGSTGGLTNKQPGRIGDTPIIGAGIYANSTTCAGETFIKNCVAHDVYARMNYQGLPLAAAIDEVILNVLPPETGGMIGVDSNGKVHASYNTAGMFTGEVSSLALVEGKGGESEAMGREAGEVR